MLAASWASSSRSNVLIFSSGASSNWENWCSSIWWLLDWMGRTFRHTSFYCLTAITLVMASSTLLWVCKAEHTRRKINFYSRYVFSRKGVILLSELSESENRNGVCLADQLKLEKTSLVRKSAPFPGLDVGKFLNNNQSVCNQQMVNASLKLYNNSLLQSIYGLPGPYFSGTPHVL